ncbi:MULTISPECIES: flavodoxin domain-containing protein [unclassified Actinotalea]|uniref:flavodoxin domain-containing protein n=1 Tax=unclassified Actinotalea TaxID=2638618 RepID=UPI0015F4E037|nr:MULTISPECIES: flavodoxin domain-containing protein [unclassified Actinotalea]
MQVLVAVASRHGSTREIAEAIADELRSGGHRVDVRDPDEVEDPSGYDAVVLGSSVYVGRWSASARALVDRLAATYSDRPVWLFSSGPVGRQPVPSDDPEEVPSLLTRLAARGHRTFAGRLDHGCLTLAERAVVSLVRAQAGDFRVWPEVARWARDISDALHTEDARRVRRGPLRLARG